MISMIKINAFSRSLLALLLVGTMLMLGGCSSVDEGMLPAFGAGKVTTVSSTETEEPEREPSEKKGITICVDPGHGYEDGGTSSELLGDILEKDITLSVSMLVKNELELRGFDVVLTHNGENFPKASNDDGNNRFKPQERVAYANSLGSSIDYYLSIHCNSFDSPDVSGLIVYHADESAKGTVGDLEIATVIKNTVAEDFPDYKVTLNTYPYYVIRYTKVPASLIELGFVTNENDAQNMLDEEWQAKMAASIADGLEAYYSGTADTSDSTEQADPTV